MISFFANLFGYVLNFLYEIVGNFGLAIILFSIFVKLLMLPISIKQQKTMKKSQKINDEMKQIQFKYKNDQEKLNQEVMALYKREKMSPFSGCFSAIVQIVLLFSVFYLVRSPLTYMRKIDKDIIEKIESVVQEEGKSSNYKEIAVINYINKQKNNNSMTEENIEQPSENQIENNSEEFKENTENTVDQNEETLTENNDSQLKENINIQEYIDKVYVNMEFLGIDLSKVPTEDLKDIKVLIIPALYVVSSFISIRLSTNQMKKKNEEKEVKEGQEEEKQDSYDAMADANKSMNWIMPIMSISIACIAPLGLALYWLVNNILMIAERVILTRFIKDDEEAENNA